MWTRPDSSEPSATEIGLAFARADEFGDQIDAMDSALPSTVDAFADLDPYVLASLRTSADEDALVAAVDEFVAASAPIAEVVDLAARRRSARSRAVLRAA